MVNNPINANASSIPFVTEPFVDSGGIIAVDWFRFLVAIYNRTGGATGTSSSDTLAQTAYNLAVSASNAAANALNVANGAATLALSADSVAASANTLANQANSGVATINQTALFASSNLSEIVSDVAARTNLGVNDIPWWTWWPSFTNGIYQHMPIVQQTTIPTNFIGTAIWCGTIPSAPAIFKVNYIRSGTTVNVGTFTIVGQVVSCSAQAAVELNVGDVIQIVAPNPADVSMANVGITFMLSLT